MCNTLLCSSALYHSVLMKPGNSNFTTEMTTITLWEAITKEAVAKFEETCINAVKALEHKQVVRKFRTQSSSNLGV